MAIFKGAGVAIVTPMKENLEVNYDKLEELVQEQIKGGTDAIIITGTTGEASTMTEEEHLDVIRACVDFTHILGNQAIIVVMKSIIFVLIRIVDKNMVQKVLDILKELQIKLEMLNVQNVEHLSKR